VSRDPSRGIAFERLTFRRRRAVTVNIEYLIEAKTGEEFSATICRSERREDDRGRVPLSAAPRWPSVPINVESIIAQSARSINKFAIAAVQHLTSELLQIPMFREILSPPLSPTRLDRLPLLELMTPRLLNNNTGLRHMLSNPLRLVVVQFPTVPRPRPEKVPRN